MATRTHDIFTTIHTEGALLPPDLIQRIADGDSAPGGVLEGLRPADYHLSGEKINEAVNRAWNVLLGAWKSFQVAQRDLPTGDLGTSVTRERWLLPLFRELDYGRLPTARAAEIDGKSYPISHRWNNVPIHLVSYQLDLDRRAPGVAGASMASPHSLLQVYLNRADDVLWGFVSNGRQLRILRDNASLTRQAYVEFDLEAMMNGEVYADFVLLWLLCHQSRVEGERATDFWLEKWMQTASQEGTRALDQLRDGVQAAIERLGEGFLAHPHNHALRDRLQSGDLIPQDYYRQLLRMVYRLLFLFVAEDRGLLLDPHADDAARARYTDFYSTRRLRHLAERFRGTRHHDLFHSLRLVMRLLGAERNGEGRALGLPVLGSYLFSDDAVIDLIGCEIGNRDLLEAVRALAFTEDRAIRALRPVDYKNLGPEELGSVYESLLELHPQINVPARTFALATAGGNERKTTGSYYTPSSLINALLDSALDPVLTEARAGGESAILDLKVCDPACGSGHFLIAAAHRVAKALASVRTGEEEPAPDATRTALRDVIGHCIYGVDINEMAVELCKVNLWMEALEPGKPLSFLDHRIQCGNSLLGTTPALMAQGIPDDAFQPIEGDDKKIVSDLRKQNKKERDQRRVGSFQHGFWDTQPPANYGALAAGVQALDAIPDATLDGIRDKERRYRDLADDPDYIAARLLADAWCAAFVWEKTPDAQMPMTDLFYRLLEDDPHADSMRGVRLQIARLAGQYQFFHWHIAFPDVFRVPEQVDTENVTGWNGGFSAVLGNPPWEIIAPEEQEFFAASAPEIVRVATRAERLRIIEELRQNNPDLASAWKAQRRRVLSEAHFLHASTVYTLSGSGNLNSYLLFVELSRSILDLSGRSGLVVPSALAFNDGAKELFGDLVRTRSLVALYDFENRAGLFPAIDSRMKFCLAVIASPGHADSEIQFAFFLHSLNDLYDTVRRYVLRPSDLSLLNPNSQNSPTFRTHRDADIVLGIYRRFPVLLLTEKEIDDPPWLVDSRRMIDLSYDSDYFENEERLIAQGYTKIGDLYKRGQDCYLPIYESKMTQQYDHRAADVVISATAQIRSAQQESLNKNEHLDPMREATPRFWIHERDAFRSIPEWYTLDYLVAYALVTSPTNHRTFLACVLPKRPAGHSLRLVYLKDTNAVSVAALCGCMNSFVLDYVCRQKIGGINLNPSIVYQLPFPSQKDFQDPCEFSPSHSYAEWIAERVLELSYTSWTLRPFAQELGWDGPPFVWDEERRFLMRCELDALYFHLYGIARDDVDYIMETFPIVRRKDIAAHGEYRTRRVILEMYDQMAESGGVEGYQTWLSPGPASPSVAHPPRDL